MAGTASENRGTAAKNVAQVGAAIGRDFFYELLAAAVPLSEPELQEVLRRLVEAGLVFQRGSPPTAEYLFKHALEDDAGFDKAAQGLLQFGLGERRGRCQQLMGKVAPDCGADLRHILGRRTEPVEAPQQ